MIRREQRLRLAMAFMLLVALLGMHRATPTASLQTVADAFELALCLGASALCFRAAGAKSGLARAFWGLFGLASLLWAGGLAAYLIASVPAASLGQTAPGDWLFTLSSMAFVVACALRPDRPRGSWRVAFDVTILAVLLCHTGFYAALGGTLAAAGEPRALAVMKDARAGLLFGCAIWLVQGSRGAWRRIYFELAGAIVVLFAGSAIAFRALLSGSFHPGLWNLPWTASFLWIGLAARDGARRADSAAAPRVFSPDWADLRHETVVAFMAIVFVPALDFMTALALRDVGLEGEGPARAAQLRTALSLATTVLVTGLLLSRQIHLLRWVERVNHERERTLRQSEERFSKAFSASPAAMSISTLQDGRYLDVNESYLRLMGETKREEVVGRTSLEMGFFDKPEDRERLVRELREGRVVRAAALALRRHSGERRDVLLSLEPIELGTTRCLLGVVEDATERLRADQALRASERRYRLLFERNLAGVFRWTPDGRILECNDSLLRILRYDSREELLARPTSDLYFSPEERDEELRLLMEMGSLTNHEACLRRKDGTPVWIVENEVLVRDDEGLSAVIEGTIVDITERKQAEEKTLRLADMKTSFLMVASHEMRTPLTILGGYHELLLESESGLSPEQRHSLQICQRTVERLSHTFNDIVASLELAGGRLALRRRPLDLREVARQVLEELAPFIERRHQRAAVIAPDGLPPVWADGDRIRDVLSNLVENAIKFTPDRGAITVRLAVEPGWHRISVEDTGIGIEPQELESIWDRFYAGANPMHHTSGTYQFKSRGSGLGLAIAKGYVEAHGGRIWATSGGGGCGSAFTALLPSAISPAPIETDREG